MQDLIIFFFSVAVAMLNIFSVFWVKCRKLLFRSWSLYISFFSFSCVHFAAGELDAFDFLGEEVLRLGNRVHRVAM